MIRKFTEWLVFPESVRVPWLGGKLYRMTLKMNNKSILMEKIVEPLNTKPRKERVIASLTSYPARMKFVHLAIKSLMVQTYKPDRIILWLAEEQFPTKELPKELTDLEKYGLEIIWMHDIYGHKKYYYPVKNQADNEVVITFDDDIIFPKNSIKRLMKKHKRFPNSVICERGQTYDSRYEKNPGLWKTLSSVGVKKPTYSLNPSPGGGCLIPKGAFHIDAINEEKIRALAYKNDDLWYMFMCAQNKTRIIKTRKYHKPFSVIIGSQVEQMATENVLGNKNVEAMERLIKAYPEAWKRIVTDED